jgi:hypothetical protein
MNVDVLEREGKELKLWISKSILIFLSGLDLKRGRWGSIYSPHLKRVVRGIFHRASPVRPSDKSGGSLWKPVEIF